MGRLGCRDISRKQLQVFFSNKHSPENLYLDSFLKKDKTKNRVFKILNRKELFLSITE